MVSSFQTLRITGTDLQKIQC